MQEKAGQENLFNLLFRNIVSLLWNTPVIEIEIITVTKLELAVEKYFQGTKIM